MSLVIVILIIALSVLTPTAPPPTAKIVEIATKVIEFVCSEETINVEALRKAFFNQVSFQALGVQYLYYCMVNK